MKIPEIRLVATPDNDPARDVVGFEWAGDDIGKRHKLGGSPDWLQDPDVPPCQECRKEMTFYGQLDSIAMNTKSLLIVAVLVIAMLGGGPLIADKIITVPSGWELDLYKSPHSISPTGVAVVVYKMNATPPPHYESTKVLQIVNGAIFSETEFSGTVFKIEYSSNGQFKIRQVLLSTYSLKLQFKFLHILLAHISSYEHCSGAQHS